MIFFFFNLHSTYIYAWHKVQTQYFGNQQNSNAGQGNRRSLSTEA